MRILFGVLSCTVQVVVKTLSSYYLLSSLARYVAPSYPSICVIIDEYTQLHIALCNEIAEVHWLIGITTSC